MANELGTLPPMHRKKQALGTQEALGLLAAHSATSGVLALNDAELGAPYVVPLSYAYLPGEGGELGSVYFHGALKGRKVELMRADARASFCVVTADEIVPERFTTYYRSVVAVGRVEVVADDAERVRALQALAAAYAPDMSEAATREEITGSLTRTCVFCLRVEQASAKEARELAEQRTQA